MSDISPISSGWQGDLQGHIQKTESYIRVKTIQVDIDAATAYALCNLLTSNQIDASHSVEEDQAVKLRNLGAAIGMLIDHPAKDNLKEVSK